MFLIIAIISLFLKFNYVESEPTYFRGFHFKHDRNPDFGNFLPLTQTPPLEVAGDLSNEIYPFPEYCCGDSSTIDNDNNLIVTNQSTFRQYWDSFVERPPDGNPDEYNCRNFGLLFPITDKYVEADSTWSFLEIDENAIRQELTGKAFNNVTKYPEYENDESIGSFCWFAQFRGYDYFEDNKVYLDFPGEIYVYWQTKKIFELSGVSGSQQVDINLPPPYNSPSLDIYGCTKTNFISKIRIEFEQLPLFCDEDGCGICSRRQSYGCPEMCNRGFIGCYEGRYICGTCRYGPKYCNDSNICTTDSCDTTQGGCVFTKIEGCCNDVSECITTDLCIQHTCENNACIEYPVQCIGNETCIDPYCFEGDCICSGITTTSEITTIATTIATTTASTIATTTASTITSTGITTDTTISSTTGTTIASTTASTIATTIATTTASTDSTITTTLSSSTSPPPPSPTLCNSNSCPKHYCCIQLSDSFTCVSKYFEVYCNNNRLKEFY